MISTVDELRGAILDGLDATLNRLVVSRFLSADQKAVLRGMQVFWAQADAPLAQVLPLVRSSYRESEGGDMAGEQKQGPEQTLKGCGVPQDVIDAAKQVEMDMVTLGKLCVDHTVEAARDFLNWAKGKLPGKQ